MPITAEAWFIHAGDGSTPPTRAELRREKLEIPDLEGDEVLVEPLYGCWEANMSHALHRKPVDICRMRGEPRVVVGNGSIVRVLKSADGASTLKPGDLAVVTGLVQTDRWGYPIKLFGYDAPQTVGCLAKRFKAREGWLFKIPSDTRHRLAQWAAFPVRYISAWANWQVAYGAYRLLVHEDEMPVLNVWGWGGGTTFAELDLARRHGHRAVMMSGHAQRLEQIRTAGMIPLDRREFGSLDFYERDIKQKDRASLDAYKANEKSFLTQVKELTRGDGVQIFVDMIGEPVQRVTLKALGRQGIITTAGWKQGMNLRLVRASACINRHQFIHTHFARHRQVEQAVAYAEASDWMPPISDRIYEYDEIPQLAADYDAGELGMFTCFRINPE
ncbi:MAG: zinc-binding dehydrogenase [Haliangiales bacterium]